MKIWQGPRVPKDEQAAIDAENREYEIGAKIRDVYFEPAAELLSHARLETEFLIQDAVPAGSLCYIVGKPGGGKSWLAYDLALAVARARPWLIFQYAQPKPQPVMILNYDNPASELARRFLKLGLQPTDPIHFHSLAERLPPPGFPSVLHLPDCLDGIMYVTRNLRPGLIVLDSLRQAHTLDELNSAQMGRVVSCLRQMTACGATVLVIHHRRKEQTGNAKAGQREAMDEDEAMRGSGELVASADLILHVHVSKKLSGEVSGAVNIGKTRGFTPIDDHCEYTIRDSGNSTAIVPGGRLDTVFDAIKKHAPITRSALVRKVHGLEPKRLARVVDLLIKFGRVREVSKSGETRALVIVDEQKGGAK